MFHCLADDFPSIKIALIGDSGVGKSAFARALATGDLEQSPIYRPTVGCNVHAVESTHLRQGRFFVELWDIGGNPRFSNTRSIFYEDCDGYIFLWDASSEATYHSLESWLVEVSQKRREFLGMRSSRSAQSVSSSSSRHPASPLPPTRQQATTASASRVTTPRRIGSSGGVNHSADADGRVDDDTEGLGGEQGGAQRGGDISVPLMIVANKIDKLNWKERNALETACPQQVFVSSRSKKDFALKAFYDFFNEVYDHSRNAYPSSSTPRSLSEASSYSTMNAVPGIRAGGSTCIGGSGDGDFDRQVTSSSRDASNYANSPEYDHEGDKSELLAGRRYPCRENQGHLQLHEYVDTLQSNQRYSGGYQGDDDHIISGGYDFDRLTRTSSASVPLQSTVQSSTTATQTQMELQSSFLSYAGTGDSSYSHSTQGKGTGAAATIPAVSSGAVSFIDADANRHVRPADNAQPPSSSSFVSSAATVTADAIVPMTSASTDIDADSRIPGSPEKIDASFLGSSLAGMFGSAEGSRRRKNSSGSTAVSGDMGLLSLSTTLFTPSSLRYRADRHHVSSLSDRERDRDYMQDKA